MGAREANKDPWEMANACVLPLYLPLSLLVSGEVLGEHNSHWWRKAREEKGFICQEKMQSRLWLGVINSTCCSEIWLWTGHIPLISLQLGDPSAGVDVNKSHSLYHLHCKWGYEMGTFRGWKEWSGIFQIPEVPEVFCIDNVNVYICISDNREVGEMVGFWVGMGGCCEMGASEMAETWDHSLEKMDALAWSVLPQSGAGNHTGFEMWNRRERKSASQGIEGIYFRDLKDWSNYFPWLFLLYSMLMTACNSHFCWWKCGRCIFCPTVISLSLYLSIQYHIPYGII